MSRDVGRHTPRKPRRVRKRPSDRKLFPDGGNVVTLQESLEYYDVIQRYQAHRVRAGNPVISHILLPGRVENARKRVGRVVMV